MTDGKLVRPACRDALQAACGPEAAGAAAAAGGTTGAAGGSCRACVVEHSAEVLAGCRGHPANDSDPFADKTSASFTAEEAEGYWCGGRHPATLFLHFFAPTTGPIPLTAVFSPLCRRHPLPLPPPAPCWPEPDA